MDNITTNKQVRSIENSVLSTRDEILFRLVVPKREDALELAAYLSGQNVPASLPKVPSRDGATFGGSRLPVYAVVPPIGACKITMT